jgi:hypothetical protein
MYNSAPVTLVSDSDAALRLRGHDIAHFAIDGREPLSNRITAAEEQDVRPVGHGEVMATMAPAGDGGRTSRLQVPTSRIAG